MFYEFVAGKYKHLFYLSIIVLIILIVFFKIAFLNYVPIEKSISDCPLDYQISNIENTLWNGNLFSGMPWSLNDTAFNDPVLIFMQRIIGHIVNWRVIFLFLAVSGVYVFLTFLKMEGAPAFLGSIFFLLSGYLLKYLVPGSESAFRAVALLPWLFFLLHYLHKRTSILALGSYLFFMILFLGQIQFQIIYFFFFISLIYWITQLMIDFRSDQYGRFLRFSLFGIAGSMIAIAALAQPYYHIIQFLNYAQSRILQIDLGEFLPLLLLFASSVIFNILLYLSLEAKFLKEKFLADLFQITDILLFITLISGFLVDRFITDLNFPDSYFILLALLCIFMFLLLGYAKEKIHKAFFLFAVFILTMGGFYLLNLDFFKNLVKEDLILNEYKPTLSDNFLMDDEELFRIYPLKNEFSNNNWTAYNQSIGGDYKARLYRYDMILQHCLHHEITNRVPLNWNVIKMLNVKYFIHNDKLDLNNLEYAFYDIKKNLTIYKNSDYLPRAWFVENIEILQDKNIVWKRLNDPEFDPARTAILENELNLNVFSSGEKSVEFLEYSDDKIILKTETDTTSFLVISEIYYPENKDWQVFIDGVETEIYTTNYILRGIIIPPGNHILEMIYRPKLLNLFRFFSLWGLIISIILFSIGLYIYKKQNYRGEIVYKIKS